MSAGDIYPRPSRETIAAQVLAQQPPGTANDDDDLADVVTRRDSEPGPLANFSVHLSARMRARGWDQAQLQKHAGISPIIAAKAINGTGCDLALAGKLAELLGGYLASMIGPYLCGTCHGEPPAGFACLECGTEARAT